MQRLLRSCSLQCFEADLPCSHVVVVCRPLQEHVQSRIVWHLDVDFRLTSHLVMLHLMIRWGLLGKRVLTPDLDRRSLFGGFHTPPSFFLLIHLLLTIILMESGSIKILADVLLLLLSFFSLFFFFSRCGKVKVSLLNLHPQTIHFLLQTLILLDDFRLRRC